MKRLIRQIYARFWLALQLFRLKFVRIPESEDAKSDEQMLKEILERAQQNEVPDRKNKNF